MLAQLRNVSLSFPDKKVLEDVSLTVYPGDRISLVGENGAGKTSIFRMLKGRLAPDSGEVSLAREMRVGYLEQDFADMEEDPKRTCMEVALEPSRVASPQENGTPRERGEAWPRRPRRRGGATHADR